MNYGNIVGILSILVVVVIASGCTLISAKPTCPVCNNTAHVVPFVDKYKTTDFKCEKCDSTHYINNTIANYPEAGWDISSYKVMSIRGNLGQNEVFFMGDSGKQYTPSEIMAYRQKKQQDFDSIYLVQNYKDPQGVKVVNNVNKEVCDRTHWDKKQINNDLYEVTCTINLRNGTEKTAKWKVNVTTGKITALDKNAEAYMT